MEFAQREVLQENAFEATEERWEQTLTSKYRQTDPTAPKHWHPEEALNGTIAAVPWMESENETQETYSVKGNHRRPELGLAKARVKTTQETETAEEIEGETEEASVTARDCCEEATLSEETELVTVDRTSKVQVTLTWGDLESRTEIQNDFVQNPRKTAMSLGKSQTLSRNPHPAWCYKYPQRPECRKMLQ